jgi:hypothetical protein
LDPSINVICVKKIRTLLSYQVQDEGKEFKILHCWNILKNASEWTLQGKAASSKDKQKDIEEDI